MILYYLFEVDSEFYFYLYREHLSQMKIYVKSQYLMINSSFFYHHYL